MSCGKLEVYLRVLALGVVGLCALPAGRASASVGELPAVQVTGPEGSSTTPVPFKADGKTFAWRTDAPGYSVSMSGDSDPFINWSFSVSGPGAYHVLFTVPVLPGTYNSVINQAAVTLSDVGLGLNPTSISNVSIDGEVPVGTSIPAVLLTGGASAPNGGFGSTTYGPKFVNETFTSPATMAVAVDFTLTSLDADGGASFNGQFVLSPTVQSPEPASLSLLCLGAMGFVGMGRSLRPRRLA
ncbi:MAG: hypothetical protein JWM97_1301 [Phycisphaerales bacterium]|nr:hypothetical protein [Phycisphaerales bacterium]